MPLCNGTDTGCVRSIDNITGRESGLTSFWCFTRENWPNRQAGSECKRLVTTVTMSTCSGGEIIESCVEGDSRCW
jgi:hypothetical protein